jgi:hypothetical protein
MRKFTFILPLAAILMATLVLASDVGSPLSGQTPDGVSMQSAPSAKDVDFYATGDADDLSVVNWTETSVKQPNSAKLHLPHPKLKKPPKKKH